MATQNKTTETKNSVEAFLKKITDKNRQADAKKLIELFSAQAGFEAKMWGTAIIGFGSYHYVYESGREGDAPLLGFSPRKNEFALYIAVFEGRDELLAKFGKHKTGKGCVYIKNTADIDPLILKKMLAASIKHTRAKYPAVPTLKVKSITVKKRVAKK